MFRKRINACLLFFICLLPLFAAAQFINNGATIVLTGGSSLVIDNLSFQNNGTFSQTAGMVSFTGSTNVSVSGSSLPVFYNIGINKPGATLQLQTGITVNGLLQFINGLLDLNANNIILDPAAQVAGETETSRLTGTTGGYVQITVPLNAPVSENPGNLGAVMTSAQNLGSVIIRRGHQSQTNSVGAGNSILRYYDIIPANNTTLNATLRLSYFDAELNGLTETALTQWKSANTTSWSNLGFSSRDGAANYVELTGISDFARFTLSTPGNTLPLVWNSFITQCTGGQVRIGWKTEQEHNTASFVIRRSNDGRNWTTLAVIPAAGNSNASLTYSYTDQQPLNGKAYYQVQQQDFDGHYSFSPILFNNCNEDNEALVVYPNPAGNNCRVSIRSNNRSDVTLRLYDSKGSLVRQRREMIQAGNNQFELSLHPFAPGIYSLVVSWSDGKTKTIRLKKD